MGDGGSLARESARAEQSAFRRRWTWRTRLFVTAFGWCLGVALRLLYRTLRIELVDPTGRVAARRAGERAIFAFWHETLVLAPILAWRVCPIVRPTVMLSWHRDGEIAAQAVRQLGVRAVRGSTTRGWVGALRGVLDAHERGDDLVLVPDGPRGPRHHAQPGVVQVACAARLPIVAIGAAARPSRRLRSWDRLQLPLPFARVVLVVSEPIRVDRTEGHVARARTEAVLNQVQQAAQDAVGGGQ